MQEVNFWNSDIMVTHAAAPFSFLFNKVFLFSRKFDKSDAAALSQQLRIQMEQRSKVVGGDTGLEKKSKLQFLPGKDNDNQKYNDKHRQEKNKI